MFLKTNSGTAYIHNLDSLNLEKEIVIFIPGAGMDHRVADLITPNPKIYNKVLSIDLPGHGSSEGPSLKSIEDMSSWVKSFMETLKIQKIIIVGHSQGCLVGIDFASKYPEFIDGLVLVAGSYKMLSLIHI